MNVLVIYGGKSCEHDISVITACLAKGYFDGEIFGVYITKDNKCYLANNNLTPYGHTVEQWNTEVLFEFGKSQIALVKRGKSKIHKRIHIDVAVNCCHGINGEEGAVASLCNYCNIPLVGSGVVPSAVAMDKVITKQVLQSLGLPVLDGFALNKEQYDCQGCAVTFPVIVKPSILGSSIGVSVCNDEVQLKTALTTAFTYCDTVLVERALTNFGELNCSAMRANGVVQTSIVDCPTTENNYLTFDDKYMQSTGKSTTTNDTLATAVKQLTAQIYRTLGFGGVIRVDYLLDNETNTLYVNEINTIPGSLAYPLWQGMYSRKEFGNALANQALDDYSRQESFCHEYSSGVLKGGHGKKLYRNGHDYQE